MMLLRSNIARVFRHDLVPSWVYCTHSWPTPESFIAVIAAGAGVRVLAFRDLPYGGAPMAHGFPSPQHAGVGLAGARMRLDRTALARKLMDKGWLRLEAEQTAEQVAGLYDADGAVKKPWTVSLVGNVYRVAREAGQVSIFDNASKARAEDVRRVLNDVEHSILYKGYEIRAAPHLLDAPRRWSIDVDIIRDDGRTVREQHYNAANTFLSEEEAVAHCLEFGRRIIDGEVPEIPRSQLP
jgi:hypothetical protein